ncbi:MAG: PAS domain S-box protein, partial [Desulfatirhabdiaceae bacterium]
MLKFRKIIQSDIEILHMNQLLGDKSKGLTDYLAEIQTLRGMSEEALRVSEIKYRTLFDVIPVGITVSDNAGNIVESNRIAEKILGLSKDDHIKRKIDGQEWCIVKPNGSPMPTDEYASTGALREHRLIENVEMGIVKERDETTWINVTATPVPIKGYGVAIAYMDITSRRLSEESMRESEERYRSIFSQSPIALEFYDENGELIDVNRACLNLFGVTSIQEIKGFNLFADPNLPYEQKERLKIGNTVRYQTLFDFEKVKEFNLYRTTRDGIIWIDAIISPVGETPHGYLVQVQDITESKRAEEALTKSEESFRQIYENMAIGVARVSLDFRIESANDAYCHMLCYHEDELIGKHLQDITHPEVIEKNLAMQKQLSAGKIDHYCMEKQFINKNGHRVYGLLNASLIRGDDGKPLYFIGSVADVTERKQTEKEREKLQAQLSNALEMAHLGHWEYDVANDRFTFNDHFYKIFRITADQVGGYTMSSAEYARRFVHPDDIAVVGEETRKAIEADDPFFSRQLEHRIIYADGTVGYITVSFFIQKDADGKTVRTYGVNQDITRR